MRIVVAGRGDQLGQRWHAMWQGVETIDAEIARLEGSLRQLNQQRLASSEPEDPGFDEEAQVWTDWIARMRRCRAVIEKEWHRVIAQAKLRAVLRRPWVLVMHYSTTIWAMDGLAVEYGSQESRPKTAALDPLYKRWESPSGSPALVLVSNQ